MKHSLKWFLMVFSLTTFVVVGLRAVNEMDRLSEQQFNNAAQLCHRHEGYMRIDDGMFVCVTRDNVFPLPKSIDP